MKARVLTWAAALTLALGGGLQLHAADRLADTVYHNGKIYTVTETMEEAKDAGNPRTVEVVATLNGKIVFAGTKADATTRGFFNDAQIKVVDLRGKTMLPGFVDGHGHFPGQGTSDLYRVNLNSPLLSGTVDSMDKLVEALAQKAETLPAGSPIIGYNYDDTQLAEQRHPNRTDLDKASTSHPILISHISGHMAVANSAALEKYGITSATDVEGLVKDADGNPTGLLLETKAMALVSLSNELKTNDNFGMERASEVYTAAGVTTADNGAAIMSSLPLYQKTLDKNQLDVRVVMHPIGYYAYNYNGTLIDAMGGANRKLLGWTGTQSKDGSNAVKTGEDITSRNIGTEVPSDLPSNRVMLGAWKFIFDGSPQGYTAWMKKPGYYDWGDYTADDSFNKAGYFNGLQGTLNIPVDTLKENIKLYHAAGQSTETHTNGSAAAEAWVGALEEAVAAYPEITDTRDTSIHGQTMERQLIERLTGHYDGLAATANMYEDLGGSFKDGTVDRTLGGLAPTGNLPELMKAQNFFISFFNNHTYFYGYRHTNKFFGPGRAFNMSPTGWAEAYNLPYSFHNDTTVTPISPLRSIQSGVTRFSGDARAAAGQSNIEVNGTGKDVNATVDYKARITDTATRKFWTYDQRVNTLQALRAVTIAPAWQNKIDDRVGSIVEGKYADFVIMDKDIFEVAKTEPMTISDLRVATTIVNDKVVHGILPDAKSFINQFRSSYNQPSLTSVVTVSDSQYIDDATAEKSYASINAGEKRFGTVSFTATVDAGSSAVFQMSILGNGEKVSTFKLYKMKANEKTEYTYGLPDSSALASASGQWWIADFTNPTIPLAQDAVLAMDKQYVVFFIIRDNDTAFDMDTTDGVINDPTTLVTTTGTMPNNGITPEQASATTTENQNSNNTPNATADDGGSSGCTVGSTPAYDLLVLFLGFTAVAAIRVLRRRNEQ